MAAPNTNLFAFAIPLVRPYVTHAGETRKGNGTEICGMQAII